MFSPSSFKRTSMIKSYSTNKLLINQLENSNLSKSQNLKSINKSNSAKRIITPLKYISNKNISIIPLKAENKQKIAVVGFVVQQTAYNVKESGTDMNKMLDSLEDSDPGVVEEMDRLVKKHPDLEEKMGKYHGAADELPINLAN